LAEAPARRSLFLQPAGHRPGWLGQSEPLPPSQRARMLDAVTRTVARKGYSRTTVADVVGLAGVSRRTFYEQFKDREDCFLAAYDTGCEVLIGNLVEASLAQGPQAGWRQVLQAAIESYLATLAGDPEFARTFLVDILGAGPAAVERRRRVHERFVEQYLILSRRAAREEAELGDVPEIYLRALVGGIAELVQQHLLTGDAEALPELAPVLVQLVTAVIRGAGSDPPAAPRSRSAQNGLSYRWQAK
jgi:AcrR family transcriptional regulator